MNSFQNMKGSGTRLRSSIANGDKGHGAHAKRRLMKPFGLTKQRKLQIQQKTHHP